MNKIVFKVNGPKDGNIAALIKGIRKFECRISLDFEHNLVTVENASDNAIDDIIDFLNTYYVLLSADINNIAEATELASKGVTEENLELPVESSTSNITPESVNEENSIPSNDTKTSVDDCKESNQIFNDFAFPKIECPNHNIGYSLNRLLRTVSWAMTIDENNCKRIVSMLWTCIREISTCYAPKPVIECSIGDIVDCFFGTQLPKEVNGSHVYSIVMEIRPDNMVYVVPAPKITGELTSTSSIPLSVPQDVSYTNDKYAGDNAYIDRATYIPATRLQKVVGKVTPEAMTRILEQHNITFDFRNKSQYSLDKLPEKALNPVAEVSAPSEILTNNEETSLNSTSKAQMDVLYEVVSEALKSIEPGGSILRNTKTFLEAIGMPTNNLIVNEAFVVASDIKKINYENVIAAIQSNNKVLSEKEIKMALKDTFKEWVSSKEALKNFPKLAFTSLLNLFAKAVRK